MNTLVFDTLYSYYLNDPTGFADSLNGNSTTSQIYRSLVMDIIISLNQQFNDISSKIVRMDFDGNIMLSNNDAYFGKTKEDVKSVPSRIQKVGDSEFLVADGLGKKAFILKSNTTNYVGIIESLYSDTPTDADLEFINAVFGNIDVVINFPKIIWQYNSSRYITSFYLMPSDTKEVSVNDDAIRDSNVWVRQGTLVKWNNNSNKPISIYSGKTNYDQFVLNPDLSMYGKEFKSTVIQPGDSWSYKFVSVEYADYFVYPDVLTGRVSVTSSRLNSNDQFLIAESDNLGQPFSSRIIKIDSWGNVLMSFGESYLVNPRSARPLLNGNIIVST